MWIVPKPDQPTGHLLKSWRAEYGLTQTQGAEHFGVSLRAWQYYESDKRRAPRKIVRSIVDTLNAQTKLELTPHVA